MAERADCVLAAGRAAAGLAARVQDAVLALLRSADPADCVSGEMPGILAVDAAASVPGQPLIPARACCPRGSSTGCLNGRQVVFRDAPADARLLHGEAAGLARHDALVRVPGAGPPALLALARPRSAGARSVAGHRRAGFPRPRRGGFARPLSVTAEAARAAFLVGSARSATPPPRR